MQKFASRIALMVGFSAAVVDSAQAQLRVVTYNVAGRDGDLTKLDAVIEALNADDKPGYAVAPHVYIFQEVDQADSTPLLTLLNANAPGGVTYARAVFTGSASEDGASGAQALYYRTDTLSEDIAGHIDIPTGGGRNTDRWLLRLVGYTSPQARFYVYSSHLKASNTAADAAERNVGAQAIRANADALGSGVHIIYAGDWNVYSNSEAAYQTFIGAGNGQAIDPLGTGSWAGSGNAIKHTQSPCMTCPSPMVNGGLDDRFDFQVATSAFNDGEGLSRIAGSYRTFGNDGLHYNLALGDGNNTYYPADIPRSNTLADNITGASDHCPLICEYQMPAKMLASLLPANVGRVIQNAAINTQLSVTNSVSVLVAAGGDELDFAATGSGALSGVQNGIANALGAAVLRNFAVNTSVVGPLNGSVTMSSTSQAAELPAAPLTLTGTVVRASNASLDAVIDVDALTIERVFVADSGTRNLPVAVSNFGFTAQQALLDVDSISGLASPFGTSGVLPTSIGAAAGTVTLTFDTTAQAETTNNAVGTIQVSDENITGATSSNVSVSIQVVTRTLIGDINGDCAVNLTDLSALLASFGACRGDANYSFLRDLDNSGCIELTDLSTLLAQFGAGC
ncbi:MAG: endonuclease/exonuclease/phosphatase family protein [Phycisphaerae bacterium]